MARDPEDERRENIVAIMVRWREQSEVMRGVPPERAREIAERDVRELLKLAGGQRWRFPPHDHQDVRTLESRDAAVLAASRRSVPVKIVLRTFRISRGHYYRLQHGRRSGKKVA
jgi:hypothetical protein